MLNLHKSFPANEKRGDRNIRSELCQASHTPLSSVLFRRTAFASLVSSIIFTITFLLTHSTVSVDGAANKSEMIRQFLDGHNSAREEVGVPPLKWHPLLARYARVYSNQRRHDCRLVHSTALVYGENIFWGQGREWSAKDAVAAWVAEKEFYHYDSNKCTGPDCSHYTQMVWRTTERVGCAKIICDSGDSFITCEYYPPGNYIGDKRY